MIIVKPNCFEKTKVRWGIFKKLSPTKLHSERSAPLAANGSQLGVRFLAYRMFKFTTMLNSQKLTLRCCYTLTAAHRINNLKLK